MNKMGLDMFLYRAKKNEINNEMLHAEVGYWGKAEQIHRWFVNNCMQIKFPYNSYLVKKTDVEELLTLCEKVKASISFIEKDGVKHIKDNNICKQLLPVYDDNNYTEAYAANIYYTIKILQRVLSETDFNNEELYYTFSN